MAYLTQPSKGRLRLWIVLCVLWFLFLPQYIAFDPDLSDISVMGALFWLVVLVWLVRCAVITRQRLRALSPPTA